jgi:exosome complex component CSL4
MDKETGNGEEMNMNDEAVVEEMAEEVAEEATEVVIQEKTAETEEEIITDAEEENAAPIEKEPSKHQAGKGNIEEETPEEKGEFVLPGDLVGTSEEFTSRNGTYEDRGNIYAATTGTVNINNKNRSVSVIPLTNSPTILNLGDIVVGQVTNMRESVALVEIAGIKGKGERGIVGDINAAIHVSNVKDAYVKDLNYEFAAFDIVKAKVIDMRNLRLSTVGKELGVMKAYCTKCRTVLVKDNGNDKLKCPKCERTETRKLSSAYGTGIL